MIAGIGSAIFDLPAYPLRFDFVSAPVVVLLFVLLAIPVVWLGRGMIPWQGPTRGWTVIGVRLAGVWVLVLLLAGARWERKNKDLEVIFLRDVSTSTAAVPHPRNMTLTEVEDDFLKRICERKPKNDRLGVVRFDDRAAIESLPQRQLRPGASAVKTGDGNGTNVAAAIQLGLAGFRGDAMRRLVLLSDGNATQGETDAAVNAANAAGVTIDVMPLKYNLATEVMVERLIAPAYKHEGSPFTIETVLHSTHASPISGSLMITDGGVPIDLDNDTPGLQERISLFLRPGVTPVRIRVPKARAGVHNFAARFDAAAGEDALVGNNVAEAITFVRGRLRVLYVDGVGGEEGRLVRDALASEAIAIDDADHVSPDRFPSDLRVLQSYDAIVLANVARGAAGLALEQERALIQYVRDLGGGIVMIGGPSAFGAGQWEGSELEEVLPVSMRPRERRVVPPGALAIVMDRSGSMEDPINAGGGTKQKAAIAAAVQAIYTLRPSDDVGVLAFDQSATWVVPMACNVHPDLAAAAIRKLAPGGGTSIYPALSAAYEALTTGPARNVPLRHILLMTDGVSSGGDYDSLLEKLASAKITLSTVAVGADADSLLLGRLARRGGGTHYHVNDAQKLTDVFVREAQSVARPMIHEPAGGILACSYSAPLPPLRGIVLTTPKPTAQILIRSASDDDVIMASGTSGMGRAVVFTSDATPRWARQWIGTPMFAKFWANVVRSAARVPMDDSIQVTTARDGPQTQLIVDAYESGGRGMNFLSVVGKLTRHGSTREAADVKLNQTGPGRYEATLPTADAGTYLAALKVQGPASDVGALSIGMVVASSQELRDLSSNDALLTQIASRTGGRVLPLFDPAARVFSREGLHPSVSSHPIHDLLICALLAITLIDVAVRRVAWDWQAFKQMALAGLGQVNAFCSTRTIESAGMLATLRQVRRDVAKQKTASAVDLLAVPTQIKAPSAADASPRQGSLWEAKRRAKMIIREAEKN